MRDDSLDLVMNFLFTSPEKKQSLAPSNQLLLERIEDCYTLQLSNPMYSQIYVRNYLMNKYKIDRNQALKIINLTTCALGNVAAAQKNWIKQKINFLLEKAYEATQAKDLKLATVLSKIAVAYAKGFGTQNDEEEMIDAKKYVNIEQVVITTDIESIGLKISDKESKKVDKLLKKYEIEDDIIDIEATEITDNE